MAVLCDVPPRQLQESKSDFVASLGGKSNYKYFLKNIK
jgi:hypothetical protein